MKPLVLVGSFISGFFSGVVVKLFYDWWTKTTFKSPPDETPEKKRRTLFFNPLTLGLTFFGISMSLLKLEQVRFGEEFGWTAFGLSIIFLIAVLYAPLMRFLNCAIPWWKPGATIAYFTALIVIWLMSMSGQEGWLLHVIFGIGLVWILVVFIAIFTQVDYSGKFQRLALAVVAFFEITGVYELCSFNFIGGGFLIGFGILLLVVMKRRWKISHEILA